MFTFIPRLFVPQQFLPTVYPDVPIHCNLCLNLHQTLVVFIFTVLRVYTATGLFPHDNSFQITVNKFKKEISLLNRLTFSSTLWNSLPTKYFLLTFVDVVALRVPFESHQWVTLIILPIQIQCVSTNPSGFS